MPLPTPGHRRPAAGGWRGLLHRLRDQQSWLDALHAVMALPLAVVTLSVVVTWWAGAVGGHTCWAWARLLPPDDDGGLAWLLGRGRNPHGDRPPAGRHPPRGGDPVRVVLAEDSMLLREELIRLLTEAGCDVVARRGRRRLPAAGPDGPA